LRDALTWPPLAAILSRRARVIRKRRGACPALDAGLATTCAVGEVGIRPERFPPRLGGRDKRARVSYIVKEIDRGERPGLRRRRQSNRKALQSS